jgi:hypothetical protein
MSNPFTLDDLEEDPWNALFQPVPNDASPELIHAAIEALTEVRDEAQDIIKWNCHSEDGENLGYAAEMEFNRDQAEDRIEELTARLKRPEIPSPQQSPLKPVPSA